MEVNMELWLWSLHIRIRAGPNTILEECILPPGVTRYIFDTTKYKTYHNFPLQARD
jgi:hypothetical protein